MTTHEAVSANILSLNVETNCPQGGDAGHGGLTILELKDESCTALTVKPLQDQFGNQGVRLELRGDTECETLVECLRFGADELQKQLDANKINSRDDAKGEVRLQVELKPEHPPNIEEVLDVVLKAVTKVISNTSGWKIEAAACTGGFEVNVLKTPETAALLADIMNATGYSRRIGDKYLYVSTSAKGPWLLNVALKPYMGKD